jgi:hypothetical protein
VRFRELFTFLLAAAGLVASTGHADAATPAELLHDIQENALDPTACYRVRDLSFAKEDVRVYLNEGYLIFTKPVDGRRTGVFFRRRRRRRCRGAGPAAHPQ